MMGDRSSPNVVVGPICYVQTAIRRFGAHALDEIKEYVNEPPSNSQIPQDDGLGESDDDDSEGGTNSAGDEVTDNDAPPAVTSLNHFDDPTPGQENDGQDDAELETHHHRIPHVARARMNLTTLSQRYNLYFAAYQNDVYVYQPQRAPQILPPVSLILRPPRSRIAHGATGCIDRSFPHQMNSIIVGELGDMEILLLAYDDGDVIAYYTHLIVHAIQIGGSLRTSNVARGGLKPFFHENVGDSAWGLAIHAHSRLIAVSSNKRDVTVFAFATLQKNKQREQADQAHPEAWSCRSALELEKHFRSRTRTWRIVLPIGKDGDNIPSITFCEDEQGHAEKVAAVDICGNMWLLDIWKIGGFATLLKPTRNRVASTGGAYRGWGILLLPDKSFRPAVSNHAAMGLPANEILGLNSSTGDGIKNDIWLDITCSLYHVRDNAADPRAYLLTRHHNTYSHFMAQSGPLGFQNALAGYNVSYVDSPLPSDDETDDEPSASPTPEPTVTFPLAETNKRWTTVGSMAPKTNNIDLVREYQLGFHLARTILPATGQTQLLSTIWQFQDFMRGSFMRQQATKVVEMRHVRLPSHLVNNFAILRATAASVELQSLDQKSASVLCRDILPQHNHHRRRTTPWDLFPSISERITMHLHVPELGLVVLGSMAGRVALLSLTKPPKRHGFGPIRTGKPGNGVKVPRAFRVETVLPRKREEDRRLRPWCTLHGIAISPVPDHRAKGLALLANGRRVETWRLILHYIDHTILMYDISRQEDDGDLLII